MLPQMALILFTSMGLFRDFDFMSQINLSLNLIFQDLYNHEG